ncbi:endonuclease domain-containing protein [Kitasatospora sp. NPDC096128]|uniref:endonuclease domain-containing protein n=1 Tax=Kitasatospora sp. NPDC096128 TaxID=3155547 RepID=UPI00332CB64E
MGDVTAAWDGPLVLISLPSAQRSVREALPGPLFRHMPRALKAHWLRTTGHLFLGATPLRGYKRSNRWHVDDRDLPAAIEALTRAAAEPGQLVPARFVWTGIEPRSDRRDLDWRLQVQRDLFTRVAGEPTADGSHLLDADADPALLLQATAALERMRDRHGYPGGRSDLAIAGLPVFDLLSRADGSWCLPTAWLAVLDTWQRRSEEMFAASCICVDCSTDGGEEASWAWRTSGQSGWVTRCPKCAARTFQRYAGTMFGVLYESTRRKRVRADDYLCSACGTTQAAAWDHCHLHHFVRGPVCASCNSSEAAGTGLWDWPDGPGIAAPGVVRHLLACKGCRTDGTLPPRYLTRLITERLRATEHHAPCKALPAVRVKLEHPLPAALSATLTCPNHLRRPVTWVVEISSTDLRAWVADLMEQHGWKQSATPAPC